MSYGVNFPPEKSRYLIKYQGNWQFFYTWASFPLWDKEVTDVIWYKNKNMVSSWWLMRDGRRYNKLPNQMVTDSELALILLQVQDV